MAGIPQVIAEDRASGAQFIDGGLRFDSSKSQHLTRTPVSASNRRTWTWSAWVKRDLFGDRHNVFGAQGGDNNGNCYIEFRSNDRFQLEEYNDSGLDFVRTLDQVTRDTGWAHWVVVYDSTQSTDNNKQKIYKNGVLQTDTNALTHPSLNEYSAINNNAEHRIGIFPKDGVADAYLDGYMSQVYMIDGQALGPENFGFTDPLTNTWRPKKYTGNFNIFPDINLASTGSGEALEVVINRQVDKAWIKNHGSSEYQGGGDPSDPTSAPTFHLPSGGNLYWFTTAYDTAHTMVIGSSSETGTQPEWASGGTTGSLTRDSATTVSGTPSSSYASARTDALADNTVYAFTYTITTGSSGNHTGWFLSTSTSYSSGVPDEQTSGNTVGARFNGNGDAYYGFLAVYGSFASINPHTHYSSYPRLDRRGINSFYLPFDGNSPIGHDLSRPNPINNGTVWSTYLSGGGGFQAAYPVTNAFNGVTTGANTSRSTNSQTTQTFTPPGGISYSSSVEVWTWMAGSVSLNGGSNITVSNDQSFRQIASGSGTINNISFNSNAGNNVYIAGIRVDGVILVDNMYGNGWTPVNFGGSNSLEKATGALPILNTTPGGTQASVGVFGSKEGFFETVSSSSGGGNPYIFDSRGTQPTLSFIRGATYVFDYSSATSHPLRFATAADAAGSTEYTTGTSISGNVISFTVPHDAPATLYYYCANHSGMGNSISITTDETKADKYASNCIVALPLVGNNADVSNSVNCTSTTKATTSVGNAAASDNTSNFYAGSFELDGTDDRVTLDIGAGGLGSGDFTFEFWSNSDTTSGSRGQFQLSASSGGLSGAGDALAVYQESGTGFYRMYVNDNASADSRSVTDSNKWNHFAVVRSGSTQKLYINGIEEISAFSSIDYTNTRYLCIGGYYSTSFLWDGYIQDVRIYKGVAKYTSDFVVASTSPDILPDTPSGVAYGSQLTKVTDGAVSFDGSGDSLSLASTSDFGFGTGDFTVEFFAYYNGFSASYDYFFDFRVSGAGTELRGALYPIGASGQAIQYYLNGSSVINAGVFSGSKWYHIALVRNSSTTTLYVDGKSVGSFSDSNNYADAPLVIGQRQGYAAQSWKGQISNFHIVKGTALYTSNFTPPTRALTAVANTKLLCCQSVSDNASAVGTMYKSTTLYTTKADIIANATVLANGGSLGGSDYFYFVPNGNETANGNVFSSNPSFTNSDSSNRTEWYWYNGSGWTETSGGYSNSDYTNFVFKDDTQTYGLLQSRDFYALGVFDTTAPGVQGGTAPTLKDYLLLNAAVSPSTIARNGDATATNFNPFITDINTVRGQETGYCTLNPLDKRSNVTLSNGNLDVTTTNSHWSGVKGTLGVNSGKYYFEETGNGGAVNQMFFGICASDVLIDPSSYVQDDTTERSKGMLIFCDDGQYQLDASSRTSYSSALQNGDVLAIALDLDGNTVEFYKNGIALGSIDISGSPLATTTVVPLYVHYNSNTKYHLNFGQKPFKFPPPNGFQPLNGANVRPETVITRPDQYVSATIYTGNNASQTVTGLKHKPDFLWFKNRTDSSASNHRLFDTVRGASKTLMSNATSEELEVANSLTSFNSDGFTVGSGNWVNGSGDAIVAWSWKAGGSKNTFNVDDVGYANASDVGMNVGGQTSNAYNQSAVWSGMCSPAPSANSYVQGFDGSTTTTFAGGISAGAYFTFTPTGGISFSNNIRVYNGAVSGASYKYNGGSATSFPTNSWTTVASGGGTMTSFATTRNTTDVHGWFAIEVDGKILVDQGLTPPAVPATAATGCSVGTKQGFSIVSYTSASGDGVSSVPHGLSQTPDFVVIKNRDTAASSQGWPVWHSAVPDKSRYLDSTNAWDATEFGHFFNSTAPNSSVVTVRANSSVSSGNRYRSYGNGDDFIMYCWYSVPGLQKFGSYTSTGTTSGPFVELGFRPALLWIKNSARNGEEWVVYDNKRQSYNPNGATLYLNNAQNEYDGNSTTGGNSRYVDFLSNGFKINDVGNPINISNQEEVHIYCAWAEAPSMNLYGAQSNAR